jgi:predicted enzyme related to lactoylglutathione lyase
MADTSSRGRFVWYDLMTTDPAKAQEFYTKVCNWGTQAWEGGVPYTMWTVSGVPLGGVMPIQNPGAPPHWLAYISCANVDETVKQAKALGAQVFVEPKDIPKVGRFAILADPQGAVFAAFASSNPPQPEQDPKVGEFSWHELATSDYQAGFDFYEKLFGWEKRQDADMGPMGIYRLFGRNGKEIGGMYNRPAEMADVPNHWLHYVMVEGAAAAAERVKAAGGKIINGPIEVPGGDWIAVCMDPQGGAFAVHSKAR